MIILHPENSSALASSRTQPTPFALISLMSKPPWPSRLVISSKTWKQIEAAIRAQVKSVPELSYSDFVTSMMAHAGLAKNGQLCCIFAGGGIHMYLSTVEFANSGQECWIRVYRWPDWPFFWQYAARFEICCGLQWLSLLYTPPGLPLLICAWFYRLRGWRRLRGKKNG